MSAGQPDVFRRGICFIVIGGLTFLVYLAVMWAMVDRLHNTAMAGAVVAFTVATIVSYIGNTLWSFQAPIKGKTAWRFLVIVLLGLAANVLIASALSYFGAGYAVISVVVFVTVPVLNFIGHQFWTFRMDGHAGDYGTET